MHAIEQFPADRRFKIIFDKFEDHDPDRFIQDVQHAALSVKGSGDYFDMLSDFSHSMVMPQTIASESEELVVWLLANGLRKSANVMQSTTQRMQIARVTQRDEKFAFFGNIEDAKRWLDEGPA